MSLNRYLRTFGGHGAVSCSYARFPYSQLDIVLNAINNSANYSYTECIGRMEIDGYVCVQNNNCREWCMIRRKNGENYWNICAVCSHIFKDFSKHTMLEFFYLLEQSGVTLSIPTYDLEPIATIDHATIQDHTDPNVRGWCRTDSMTVDEAQKLEAGWLRNITADNSN